MRPPLSVARSFLRVPRALVSCPVCGGGSRSGECRKCLTLDTCGGCGAREDHCSCPPRCVACGREHLPRPFLTVVTEEDRARYRSGGYRFPVPPVATNGWDEDSWVRWIDGHGEWSALSVL